MNNKEKESRRMDIATLCREKNNFSCAMEKFEATEHFVRRCCREFNVRIIKRKGPSVGDLEIFSALQKHHGLHADAARSLRIPKEEAFEVLKEADRLGAIIPKDRRQKTEERGVPYSEAEVKSWLTLNYTLDIYTKELIEWLLSRAFPSR